MAAIQINRTVDLSKMVQPEALTGVTFTEESGGHEFVLTPSEGTLSGTIKARFMRSDGSTQEFYGSTSGGSAHITLTADCYEVAGRFLMTVFYDGGDGLAVIYAAVGHVMKSSNGTVTPSQPAAESFEDILADYVQQMESATAAANTSATGATTAAGNATAAATNAEAALSVAFSDVPVAMTSGSYLNTSYQGIRNSAATSTINGNSYPQRWLSGWMDVRAYDKIRFSTTYQSGYVFRSNDENFGYGTIVATPSGNGVTTTELDVPDWARYFAFSAYIPNSNTFDETIAQELTSGDYTRFWLKGIRTGERYRENYFDMRNGRQYAYPPYEKLLTGNVLCIGDSLTAGGLPSGGSGTSGATVPYTEWLADFTGLTVDARAHSGYSASDWWNDADISKDFTGYNTFVVWFGTNHAPVTAYDAEDTSSETYYYTQIIQKIITDVPSAKVILGAIFATTTPHSNNQSWSQTVSIANETIRAIAARYPNNVIGVANMDDGTLFGEGCEGLHGGSLTNPHFTAAGYMHLAYKWLSEIRRCIGEKINLF